MSAAPIPAIPCRLNSFRRIQEATAEVAKVWSAKSEKHISRHECCTSFRRQGSASERSSPAGMGSC